MANDTSASFAMRPYTIQTPHSLKDAADSTRTWFKANEIASIYKFNSPDLSKKIVVGVISFGGGLVGTVSSSGVLTDGDIQKHWGSLNIPNENMPKVIIVPVSGAINSPNPSNSATIENTIDIETIGACCPSSNLTILLYLTLNTKKSFFDVFNTAINNTVFIDGEAYKPSILSVSWGAPEPYFTTTELTNMNTLFQSAAQKGINICTATGDNGSNNGVGGTGNYTDFPASSPYVVACGGTKLICPSKVYDSSTVETAWTYGGGGISKVFPKPPYQFRINASGRSIPDISLNADPNTGVQYLIGGALSIIGGTSIAAPAFAAYLACIDNNKFITPLLYNMPSATFNDVINGTNGGYKAYAGYDFCSGFGSIVGDVLTRYYSNSPIAVLSISVDKQTLIMNSGESAQITEVIMPSNATNQIVKWVSSDPSIATVENGLVKALRKGTVIITVSSESNSLKARTNVTIDPLRVADIKSAKSNVTLNINSSTQLTYSIIPVNAYNKSVTWESDNQKCVSVSNKGVINALTQGQANIKITTFDGGKQANVLVNVIAQIQSIRFRSTNIILKRLMNHALQPIVTPSQLNNIPLLWDSSNKLTATVDSSGFVTTLRKGTTVITAKSSDGKIKSSVTLSVY